MSEAIFKRSDIVIFQGEKATVVNIRMIAGEWWYTLCTNNGYFIDPDDHETRRHDPKRITFEYAPEEEISPALSV